VLRLTGQEGTNEGSRNKKSKKNIFQFIQNASACDDLEGIGLFAAKEESYLEDRMEEKGFLSGHIDWSSKRYWEKHAVGKPWIMVIDQTASRSTEFKCHDRIFAYHDYRKQIVYSTICQAQQRVNHYEQTYGGFQPIRVYGHKPSWQASARLISYSDLQATGNVTVADRVAGGIKTRPLCKKSCKFYPCSQHNFADLDFHSRLSHRIQNPFNKSLARGLVEGKFQGHLRGKWGVLDYSHVQRDHRAAKVTICYKEGILGVALVERHVQERKPFQTTPKSMYVSHKCDS
jgi:hypothetical protein